MTHPRARLLAAASFAALSAAPAARADDSTGHLLNQLLNAQPGQSRLGDAQETRDLAGFWLIPNVEPFLDPRKSFIKIGLDEPQPAPINMGRIDPLIGDDPLGIMATPLRNVELWMRENLGVRTDLYDLTVAQRASRALPGREPWAISNRFNLRFDWKLWEIQGAGTGSFTAQFRANNNWSAQNVNLSSAIGSSVVAVDSADSAKYAAIQRFFFQQGFAEDRLLVGAGKINPNDTTAQNFFAGDETNQFLASVFNGGDALPSGWSSTLPGVYAQFIPCDGLYVNAIATSPLGGGTTGLGFGAVGDGLYMVGAEAGLVVALGAQRELAGRYSVFVCNTNAGNATTGASSKQYGSAMAVIAQQFIDRDIGLWISYELSDRDVSPASQELTFGGLIENTFNRHGDAAGIALGWTKPSVPGEREQKTLEAFYRLRLTGSMELSPDIQMVVDPTNPAASTGVTWVFGLRSKIKF